MARIVIVDDDASIRHLVQRYLVQQGHTVETAANGQEVFSLVQTFSPDLVVLDLNLPDISGYELCAHLQTHAPPSASSSSPPALTLGINSKVFTKGPMTT